MLHELRLLDVDTLTQLYTSETDKLKTFLLNGAKWEEVQEQRYKLIDFEIALYQKMRYAQNSTSRLFGR
ncbi:MAG: hypothetical protein JWP69_44 [Flaviaesturariibacter sp.]|nr:hypothetical protein [Flaviaesturariibacter sp.]